MDNTSLSNSASHLEDICDSFDKLLLSQEGEEVGLKSLEKEFECVDADKGSEDDDPCKLEGTLSPSPELDTENVIADYRARLYCFEPNEHQWTNKGVGVIHILQSSAEKKDTRVVMWVDGNGRVACNFRLFPEFVVKADPRNPAAVHWRSLDHSDPDMPSWETFACRFFSEEDCTDFKTKVMQYAVDPPAPAPFKDLIESGSTCSGCIGCDPDAFEFPQRAELKIECLIDCQLDAESSSGPPMNVTVETFL